jgi:hypothetical protein
MSSSAFGVVAFSALLGTVGARIQSSRDTTDDKRVLRIDSHEIAIGGGRL